MASPAATAVISSASSTPLSGAGEVASSPPILAIFPILATLASVAFSLLISLLSLLSHLLVKPLLAVLPIFTALFYPIWLSLFIVLDALVVTPYTIATGILAALYPLYVLVGVACIAGLVVGVFGRWMTEGLRMAIMSVAPQPWPKYVKSEPKKLQQEQSQKPQPPIYGTRSPVALRKRRRRTAFQEPGTSYQT